ncbi:MAG: hypothetical protein ABGW77_04410, partial [Campylobacterales bacterium]
LNIGRFPGAKANPLEVELKFFAPKKLKIGKLPYLLIGKVEKRGKLVIRGEKELEQFGLKEYNRSSSPPGTLRLTREILALKRKIEYGIVSPDHNLTTATSSITLKIVVPLGRPYQLTQNGVPVSEDRIGERAKDKSLGIEKIEYVALPLREGENIFRLKFGHRQFTRKVFYTTRVADLSFQLYPPEVPADGRTPPYLVIKTVDENGHLVPLEGFMQVSVDKGDIFDYTTGRFRHYPNDQFNCKVVAGKGILKLSPAVDIEERVVKVKFKGLEREFKFSFVQEKRPWLIDGLATEEWSWNWGRRKGVDREGLFSIFGKGTVGKEYTLTFRYSSTPPEESFETPNSGEEGYLFYGDSSKGKVEGKSQKRLYLKVAKGKSYLMYGDFKTGFGKGTQFEKYDRHFTGVKLDWGEKGERWLAFLTKTTRELIREESQGSGLSGPYYWHHSIVPESEQVWIEVRNRENPDIILSTRKLSRFDDYEIDYYNRFLICREPVPEVDSDGNPVYLVIQYESDEKGVQRQIYGVRREQKIGPVKVGVEKIKEGHQLGDRELVGGDLEWKKGSWRVKGEIAFSTDQYQLPAPVRGWGKGVEVSYTNRPQQLQFKGNFSRVTKNFSNPSASIVSTDSWTYQLDLQKKWEKTQLRYQQRGDRNPGLSNRERSLTVVREVSKGLKVEGGLVERLRRGDKILQTLNGKYQIKWSPFQKLQLGYSMERNLKGGSGRYWSRKRELSYQIQKGVNFKITNSETIQNEQKSSATLIGLDSKLKGDTKGYAKYQIDDVASGRQVKALLGVNKVFHLSKEMAFNGGVDQVKVIKGDQSQSSKVFKIGAEWTFKEDRKASLRYQLKIPKGQKREKLIEGGYSWKLRDGTSLILKERYFLSKTQQQDFSISFAYRPLYDDRLNLLLKSQYTRNSGKSLSKRWFFLGNLNYQSTPELEWRGQLGVRFQRVEGVGISLLQLLRGGVLKKFPPRWRAGGYLSILHSATTGSYQLYLEPEIGYTPLKGLWLVAGYRRELFRNTRFPGDNYRQEGFFFRVEFKFDEKSLKEGWDEVSSLLNSITGRD